MYNIYQSTLQYRNDCCSLDISVSSDIRYTYRRAQSTGFQPRTHFGITWRGLTTETSIYMNGIWLGNQMFKFSQTILTAIRKNHHWSEAMLHSAPFPIHFLSLLCLRNMLPAWRLKALHLSIPSLSPVAPLVQVQVTGCYFENYFLKKAFYNFSRQ